MPRSWKKLLIPALILLFPVIFWLILTRGTNQFRILPVLGPIHISENGDTVNHRLPFFSFRDQDGRIISSDTLLGKILIAGFIFPGDTQTSEDLNYQLRRLQNKLDIDKDLRLLSFYLPVKGNIDSLLQLDKEKYDPEPGFWYMLNGQPDSVRQLAREGFLTPVISDGSGFSQNPITNFWLLDKEMKIRGMYDGQETTEIDSLIGDLKLLRLEYHKMKKLYD